MDNSVDNKRLKDALGSHIVFNLFSCWYERSNLSDLKIQDRKMLALPFMYAVSNDIKIDPDEVLEALETMQWGTYLATHVWKTCKVIMEMDKNMLNPNYLQEQYPVLLARASTED